MNAVGIDVSKGRSTIAIVQPFGVIIAEPFEVSHNAQELKELVERLKLLSGETKVIMEYTGTYYEPIANALHNADIFVSVVNPLAINDYDKALQFLQLQSLFLPPHSKVFHKAVSEFQLPLLSSFLISNPPLKVTVIVFLSITVTFSISCRTTTSSYSVIVKFVFSSCPNTALSSSEPCFF